MTNHEGICAFSLRKGFDAMFHAPFDRVIISALLFLFDSHRAIIAISEPIEGVSSARWTRRRG